MKESGESRMTSWLWSRTMKGTEEWDTALGKVTARGGSVVLRPELFFALGMTEMSEG